MLKLVVLPAISLIVMVPLTMLVIGPPGVYAGEAIAFVVNWLIERSPCSPACWLAAAGPCWCPWASTGP